MKFVFNPFTGNFSPTEDVANELTKYLPLSGGTVTGILSCTDSVFISGGRAIVTNTTGVPAASAVQNIITLSEADYNAIVVKNPQTLYIVV